MTKPSDLSESKLARAISGYSLKVKPPKYSTTVIPVLTRAFI
jgi:hypothetical protein